jgi:hypothetical protein
MYNYGLKMLTVASASGVLTLDYSKANAFQVDLTENITSIVIDNPPSADKYGEIYILFVQNASAAKTITWPAKYKFAGGTAMVMSTGLSAIDDVHLLTTNAGTTWRVKFAQAFS